MKLWCRLFGHDFRSRRDEGEYRYISVSDWCCNCGLTKKEAGEMTHR